MPQGQLDEEENSMKIDELSNSQISEIIDEWVRGERNRKLLKRRLIDGICYEPLAEEFDLSVCQVKNIIYKEQDKVFKVIEGM